MKNKRTNKAAEETNLDANVESTPPKKSRKTTPKKSKTPTPTKTKNTVTITVEEELAGIMDNSIDTSRISDVSAVTTGSITEEDILLTQPAKPVILHSFNSISDSVEETSEASTQPVEPEPETGPEVEQEASNNNTVKLKLS
jgi:hypothetical protein